MRALLPVALLLALASTAACTRPQDAAAGVPGTDATSSTSATTTDADAGSLFDLPSRWVTSSGRAVDLRDVAGEVSVVTMLYTNCQVTCPIIIGELARVESALSAAEREHVRFLLVTLDPERDTPGRLAAWARDTKLDSARWVLLSGTDHAVRELAAALDVRYQHQRNGEIAHTNESTILDAQGRIVWQRTGLGEITAFTDAVRGTLACCTASSH